MATKARKAPRKPVRKPARKTARKTAGKRKSTRTVVRSTTRTTVRSNPGGTAASRARKRAAAGAKARARATAQKVQRAKALAESFHGRPAKSVRRVAKPRTEVGVVVGKLTAVLYRRPDGQEYMHEFRGQAQPTLAATRDGRQLIVQGGRYRFTSRGIVDKRK